jgi:hypothetical protein
MSDEAYSFLAYEHNGARTEHYSSNVRLHGSSTTTQAFVTASRQILQTEPTFPIFFHGILKKWRQPDSHAINIAYFFMHGSQNTWHVLITSAIKR